MSAAEADEACVPHESKLTQWRFPILGSLVSFGLIDIIRDSDQLWIAEIVGISLSLRCCPSRSSRL